MIELIFHNKIKSFFFGPKYRRNIHSVFEHKLFGVIVLFDVVVTHHTQSSELTPS